MACVVQTARRFSAQILREISGTKTTIGREAQLCAFRELRARSIVIPDLGPADLVVTFYLFFLVPKAVVSTTDGVITPHVLCRSYKFLQSFHHLKILRSDLNPCGT